MQPETSANKSSIPVGRASVKRELMELLVGLPVTVTEYGVTIPGAMTAEEFLIAFERLFTFESRVIVRVRFKIGDLWNRLHESRYRSVRKSFMAILSARPDQNAVHAFLKRLSVCGWVANKWDVGDRSEKRCWSWYVKNPEETKAETDLPYYCGMRSVMQDVEALWFECGGTGDKRIMVRIPRALLVEDEP